MELYFSPLACSLATRIALYEAGADARFIEVDSKTKQTPDGSDYRAVHPLGLVPSLRLDDGQLLTESAAILQYVARSFPAADLAPREGLALARLQQWLCFIGTELHKALFNALLDPRAPEVVKGYVLEKYAARFGYVDQHLQQRTYLLDSFSVADAYLCAVLTWTVATPIDLSVWPALVAYKARLRERPSVARALAEERELYGREQARQRQA